MQLSTSRTSEPVKVFNTRQVKFRQARSQSPQSNVRLVASLASASVTAGFLAMALPMAPAIAAGQLDYERCTATLAGLKISTDEAAAACARAFRPVDLSKCVSTINRGTSLPAAEALGACRQVRRPVDMGNCVVDIRRGVSGISEVDALNNCRSSLLPSSYANCVLGENRSLKLDSAKLLNTCIDASDFARDLDPTFIPYTTLPTDSGVSPAPTDGLLAPASPITPANPTTPTPTTPASPANPTTP